MKSVVLLSGGLDSAVNLAQACRDTDVSLCLNFNYGQRAAQKELAAAKHLAEHYQVPLQNIVLEFLGQITRTALVNRSQDIPEPAELELDQEIARQTAAQVWVPNRNGLFINIAASFAESLDCSYIVTGFNREEAATFPDNSREYLAAANAALAFSAANQPKVISYTQDMDKKEIVALGKKLGLPFEYIWSCYHGGEEMCGKCESCQRYNRAMNLYQKEDLVK